MYHATTEITTYFHTLALHDALPMFRVPIPGSRLQAAVDIRPRQRALDVEQHRAGLGERAHAVGAQFDEAIMGHCQHHRVRSEEHTSELQSLMRISYAVFCLKKKIYTCILEKQPTSKIHLNTH